MSIWVRPEGIVPVPLEHRLSLGEGRTPSFLARRLGREAGLERLVFKLESINPTGSYKDRFAAAAVSWMQAQGIDRCVATSSGNTGAALAAYCAAAGIRCRIAAVESPPEDKLRQMQAYGAEVVRVRRFGLDPEVTSAVFERLREIGETPGSSLQVSAFRYSPEGMSGVRSLGYELLDDMDNLPDDVFCPVGGGGLALAVAQAVLARFRSGEIERMPRVHCVQPEGNDTVVSALREPRGTARAVQSTTRISGLQVASVVDGDAAVDACRATGGSGFLVSDELVWKTQARLAREEGIFAEPAGATATAGVCEAVRRRAVDPGNRIVALVTGSGFKDEASARKLVPAEGCPLWEPSALERWSE